MFSCVFSGGESAWGAPFKDEFKPNLIHQGGWQNNSCVVYFITSSFRGEISGDVAKCRLFSKANTETERWSPHTAKTWRLRNERRNSKLLTRIDYPDLVSASDWLKLISNQALWSFCARFSDVILRGNFLVMALRNVGYFLRLCWWVHL